MITAYVVDQQQRKRKMLIQKAQALAMGADETPMDGSVAISIENLGEGDGLDLGLDLVNHMERRRHSRLKATDLVVTRPIAPTLLEPGSIFQECLFRDSSS